MSAAIKTLTAVALLLASPLAFADEPKSPQWSAHLIHVHLEANGPATFLQQIERSVEVRMSGGLVPLATAVHYADVCAAPCDAEVDSRQRFRIGGDDVHETSIFTLPSRASSVSVKAQVGSLGGYVIGEVCTIVGGIILAGATTGLVFALTHNGDQSPTTLAGVGVGVGLGSLLLGIPLWIANGTHYSIEVDPAP